MYGTLRENSIDTCRVTEQMDLPDSKGYRPRATVMILSPKQILALRLLRRSRHL